MSELKWLKWEVVSCPCKNKLWQHCFSVVTAVICKGLYLVLSDKFYEAVHATCSILIARNPADSSYRYSKLHRAVVEETGVIIRVTVCDFLKWSFLTHLPESLSAAYPMADIDCRRIWASFLETWVLEYVVGRFYRSLHLLCSRNGSIHVGKCTLNRLHDFRSYKDFVFGKYHLRNLEADTCSGTTLHHNLLLKMKVSPRSSPG